MTLARPRLIEACLRSTDELETLNRDQLDAGFQARNYALSYESIIDVTTTLTDAEVGVFFFHEERGGWQPLCKFAARGPTRYVGFPANSARDLFSGADCALAELVRILDLEGAGGMVQLLAICHHSRRQTDRAELPHSPGVGGERALNRSVPSSPAASQESSPSAASAYLRALASAGRSAASKRRDSTKR